MGNSTKIKPVWLNTLKQSMSNLYSDTVHDFPIIYMYTK